MQCPKCQHFMKTIEYKGIAIERCTSCYGLWFDDYELDDIKKLKGSEVIDIGDPDVGKEQNENTRIRCPKCRKMMMPEIDEQQKHIRFERCQACRGVYFDAGEYRDKKNFTLMERIKSIFSRD